MRYDIFGINNSSLDVTLCMTGREGMANNAVADDSQVGKFEKPIGGAHTAGAGEHASQTSVSPVPSLKCVFVCARVCLCVYAQMRARTTATMTRSGVSLGGGGMSVCVCMAYRGCCGGRVRRL